MKNTKILVLILSLALVLGAVAGISVSAAGETAPTEVSIKSANLSFLNEPALVFAIEHDGDASQISLNVWNSEPAEGQAADYVVTDSFEQTIEGVTYTSFAVNGKNPKYVDEYVWVQAVAGDVKSDVVRYSILQYALGGVVNGANPERYQSIIDYSASAQKWLEYTDANGKTADEYVFVSVEGGTVDGYKNGVYPKGTQITPEGDGVAMWSVESDSNKSNVYYGQPITLTANTKITVNNTVMTFEDCTDISDINGATLRQANNGSAFNITEFDGDKVLTVDTVNDGTTGRTEVIFNVNNTITDAEAVVLEFDLYVDVRNTSGQTYAIEMRDSADVRVVYLTIDDSFGFNCITSSGTSKINTTLATDKWMKFRVEYLDLGETKGLKVYVDGNSVLVLDDYASNYSPASREIDAITNIRFDTYGEIVTHFDNVMLMQEKIENLDKVIAFDDGEVPSSITVNSTYGANLEVVNDSEKGNVLKFESAETYGEGFTVPVLDAEAESNCIVFEADISVDVLDSAVYPGPRINFVDSSGKNAARFELKRGTDGNISYVQYTCGNHYSSPSVPLAVDGNDNWFNLRVEYYEGTRDTVRTKVYLDGTLIFVYDDFMSAGTCSTCDTSITPATVDSITTVKIFSPSANYTGTMLIDNIVFEKVVKTCADDPLTE